MTNFKKMIIVSCTVKTYPMVPTPFRPIESGETIPLRSFVVQLDLRFRFLTRKLQAPCFFVWTQFCDFVIFHTTLVFQLFNKAIAAGQKI